VNRIRGKKSRQSSARNFHPSFDSQLKPFVSGKIAGPHMVNWDLHQQKWLRETADKLKPELPDLYSRHEISPAAVLFILGYENNSFDGKLLNQLQKRSIRVLSDTLGRHYIKDSLERSKRQQGERSKQLRGEHQKEIRAKDLKVIDDCLSRLEIWRWAILESPRGGIETRHFYDTIMNLRSLCWIIENTRGTPPHRPTSDLKPCARALGILFKHVTGKPLYKTIGEILQKTFPDRWLKPMSDQKDVVSKLIGKSLKDRSLAALEAIDIQEQNQERSAFWEQQRTKYSLGKVQHREPAARKPRKKVTRRG
jgi:hypothetical protein